MAALSKRWPAWRWFLAAALGGGAVAVAAAADRPRFLTAGEPKPAADSNFVERVEAPGAALAVVNEPARMLAVAHSVSVPHQLSLFPLDDTGRVITAAPPVTITLPKPASLAAYTNAVVGMVTHPRRPLLYVLQNLMTAAAPPMTGDPKTNPVFNEFDRLFVYRLDPTNTELVATMRGEWFQYGAMDISYPVLTPLGIDADNGRLYLPCLRDPAVTNAVRSGIGYLELDDDGLPRRRDGQVVPPVFQHSYGMGAITGLGWLPCSRDRVIFGYRFGLATWDLINRRAPITIKYCSGDDPGARVFGHPTAPILYRSVAGGALIAYELADGFPTLLPQNLQLPLGCSSPQLLAKRNQIAFGAGGGRIGLVDLQPDGSLTDRVSMIPVPGGTAFCYAPGFDRLYATAEKVKP